MIRRRTSTVLCLYLLMFFSTSTCADSPSFDKANTVNGFNKFLRKTNTGVLALEIEKGKYKYFESGKYYKISARKDYRFLINHKQPSERKESNTGQLEIMGLRVFPTSQPINPGGGVHRNIDNWNRSDDKSFSQSPNERWVRNLPLTKFIKLHGDDVQKLDLLDKFIGIKWHAEPYSGRPNSFNRRGFWNGTLLDGDIAALLKSFGPEFSDASHKVHYRALLISFRERSSLRSAVTSPLDFKLVRHNAVALFVRTASSFGGDYLNNYFFIIE